MPCEPKDQFCFNCGEDLGRYIADWRDLQVCGKPECVREARDQERGRDEEARMHAEQDGYERYR